MTAKNEAATTEREIVVSRVIDAPRERVWKAWADPAQVVKWWGPRGFSTNTDARDFRPGGTWKHVMIGPDGAKYPNSAVFLEVVEPERIVYRNGGVAEGETQGVGFVSTVTFKDLGNGKTELTMRLVFDTQQMRDFAATRFGAVEGGNQTLSRLAEHCAGEFVVSRLLDAPRERVWRAWTEAERLSAWFGPKGAKVVASALDLRPGGTYHYGLRMADGKEMWGKWTFREVAALERLVFVQHFSDAQGGVTRHPLSGTWPLRTLSTLLFQEMGDKTLLTLKWVPLDATAEERATFDGAHAQMRGGWGGTLDQFADYLKEASHG